MYRKLRLVLLNQVTPHRVYLELHVELNKKKLT